MVAVIVLHVQLFSGVQSFQRHVPDRAVLVFPCCEQDAGSARWWWYRGVRPPSPSPLDNAGLQPALDNYQMTFQLTDMTDDRTLNLLDGGGGPLKASDDRRALPSCLLLWLGEMQADYWAGPLGSTADQTLL